jgi:hypothetical protein
VQPAEWFSHSRPVRMIGHARPPLAWWVREAGGQFRDDRELPRRRRA